MTQNNGYGKRPLWQWIIIYAVIAVVVYGVVYYFIIAKKSIGTGGATTAPNTQTIPGY